MDPRDRKLLELAGWVLSSVFADCWRCGDNEYETRIGKLSSNQGIAERVADAVIPHWLCWSQHNGSQFDAFTVILGDPFDSSSAPVLMTWNYGESTSWCKGVEGCGLTRAEAITAMLYAWLKKQP